MLQLDDEFLRRVGLGDLAEDEKASFLQHVYSEMELRTGTRLSDGLSDRQLEEFEAIIDKNDRIIVEWLELNVPDFENDELFVSMQEDTDLDPTDPELLREYVATKWLEVNRPDYREVTAQVLSEIESEIRDSSESLKRQIL